MTSQQTTLVIRYNVDDEALSRVHADSFSSPFNLIPWKERLTRHSVSWIGAFSGDRLVGFVHAVWDGGAHAFLLDTVVSPGYQHRGIGTAVVKALVKDISAQGCQWLHVDYEPHLTSFYREACGFNHPEAGLLEMT
jgi:ribosomal protein S18 acetylase RimI-like enzyme